MFKLTVQCETLEPLGTNGIHISCFQFANKREKFPSQREGEGTCYILHELPFFQLYTYVYFINLVLCLSLL